MEEQKKEEIPLREIFSKIGLDKQNWDFHQTVECLEFAYSNGGDVDFHFAIDIIIDLAVILLECYINGSVNLRKLNEYDMPSCHIRITATAEEYNAINNALSDFAKNPFSYDLHELVDDEDMKELLSDGNEAEGCIATNCITVEGYKVGYCYREKPDEDWDSGWRFTAGDESDEYMDDPWNAGVYTLNTICNDDPEIIYLLNTPVPCAFERDESWRIPISQGLDTGAN